MKLSIIIPFYNTQDYTDELLKVLEPQIKGHIYRDVEVILIDDGSNPAFEDHFGWLNVLRQENQGPAIARNTGIENALGDYIQFIDSDDMVSEDFVEKILKKIPKGNDLIEFSWKSLSDYRFNCKLNGPNDRDSFPGVVLRTFKRSYIGKKRFSIYKDATEDEDFSRQLGYLYKNPTVSVIPEYLYFYRSDVEGSNVKSFKDGLKNTKRIVYYYDKVNRWRTDILDAIKMDDVRNEVLLLTNECEIPELKRWCQIYKPFRVWTHYLKGEPCSFVEIIPIPIKADVILFIRNLNVIGGIETFIIQFCRIFAKKRNMLLLVANIPDNQRKKISEYVEVVNYSPKVTYTCNTLIMLRILDTMPPNIEYQKSVQMCHGCRTNPQWHIPQNTDYIVNVSKASRDSFGEEAGQVIHNPIIKTDKRALVLVSATRIPAPDKGKNEERMRKLAEMLNEAEIPFLWFNFSEGQIPNPPKGMVNMGICDDIQPYIARADYLVQLSDSEAWSYSILEALVQNVPVLVCPFPSADEMGVEDGGNGYYIPFDMDFDVNKLLDVPKFNYLYTNKDIEKEWEKIFNSKPKKTKRKIQIIQTYIDTSLGRTVKCGEVVTMSKERAKLVCDAGYGKEIR